MGLFGRKFKASKVAKLANLAISRISILKNQHQVRCSLARSDVSQLLHLGRHEDALHRVELVIKEQNTVDALAMMEKYCHLLIEKRVLIKTKGECPEELAEAISSLIFAASRWGEFPELHEVREIFTSRYGNEFAAQCVELRNNCSVQPKMIPKLSKRHTGSGKRRDMLNDIAADCGITLCVEDETSQISQSTPEVNSENECAEGEEVSEQDTNGAPVIKLEGSRIV
ncbi:IST1-like protein [Capsicum galapagoense]